MLGRCWAEVGQRQCVIVQHACRGAVSFWANKVSHLGQESAPFGQAYGSARALIWRNFTVRLGRHAVQMARSGAKTLPKFGSDAVKFLSAICQRSV